jgi:ATP-dependent RNA helicase DeaD
MKMSFEELGLDSDLLQAVVSMGFTEPTAIQAQSIPVLLQGEKDFLGLAQTGTGKTAAFGLPLLQLVDPGKKFPQALIICPTRELCLQITNELDLFKQHKRGIQVTAVYGGAPISQQVRDLKKGTHIVVATPGRLIDLIERKAIDLQNIKYVVLDEADEMLNMGFQDDVEFILKNAVNRDSIWLFSATMPPAIRKVVKTYMDSPAEVSVGKVNAGNKSIDHQYYIINGNQRYESLKRLIDFNPGIYGLIFTRTKVDAQEITEKLVREGYDVDAIHGDLNQGQRDKVMAAFRSKSLQLLIATDVAARGIDVTGITHVINFELPDDMEVYTHRSGRTGRAGNTGICLSLVSQRESGKIKMIERMIQATFHRFEIPSGKDVCRKQFFHFMEGLQSADISHGDYETYLPLIMEKFADVSKEEILQRVVAKEFNRFLEYYENAADLNTQVRREDRKRERTPLGERSERGERGDRSDRRESSTRDFRSSAGFQRLFVNLGTKDGFYKASFLQFILDMSDLRKDVLGKIDMRELNSWVEVESGAAGQMIKAVDGKNFKGRRIRMNEA